MPRMWMDGPAGRVQAGLERMAPGSIKGRVKSASPVRERANTGSHIHRNPAGVLHDFFQSNPTIPSATATLVDWDLHGSINDGITEQSDPTQPTVLADGMYMIICTLQLDPNVVEAESTFGTILPTPLDYGATLYFAHDAGGTAALQEPADTGISVVRMSAGNSIRLYVTQTAAADRSYRFSAEVVKLG